LYQHLVESCVLINQPEDTIDSLSWSELCVLLYDNVDALILDFRRAKDKISHLERVCRNKSDTMRDLQRSQEEAFLKVAEQMKAQEHCWQKEKKHLELQYSNLLAEAYARAQEYQAAAQKNREKMYVLEKNQEKLTHENVSAKTSLTNAEKERSCLLAACALLSGALCPLYGRLCAMSCQRNILQDQVNVYELVNQKIRTIVHAAAEENNRNEASQRQRKAKGLVYVIRRTVIAVLAANRLRALAQRSSSLFTWTNGMERGTGIRVCVGESEDRYSTLCGSEHLQGLYCIIKREAHITPTETETQILLDVVLLLFLEDPNSWLSGNSLVSAARNSFSKLMDKLSIMLEMVPLNYPRCITYLEKDSLIQRLACGLLRLNNQAIEAGL
ncbi:CC171 protein, partial [Smithornis capensis]|nr:CC171 protein [Smithornis capensis]